MSWVFGTVAVTLGLLLLWGLVAPRSLWRVLAGWSVSDTHAHEPGGTGYGVRRLFFGLGILALVAVAIVGSTPLLTAVLRPSAPPQTSLETMWGSPTPQLVGRVVHPLASPPAGLVEAPVLGYQELDPDEDVPAYLLALPPFRLLGETNIPGYIGTIPEKGFSPFTAADLVVHVRGPLLCVPRQAVVVETETTVQVAIYYGLPERADGTVPDHVAGCPAGDPVTGSVLIPIVLSAPLGDREVQALDGSSIQKVALAD